MSEGAGAIGGGAVVGVAQGRVEIDMRQLQAARDVMVRAARDMDSTMIRVGQTTDATVEKQVRGWQRVQQSISENTKMLGGLLSLVTGFGVRASNSLKRLDVAFVTMSGSQAKANEYMKQLENLARRTNQPFTELKESAISFLPAVRSSNVELEKTVLLAQRLMLKDPTARVKDSIIAINELLSGEAVSLARRFEIPKNLATEWSKLAETDPAAAVEAVSAYLDSIGLTEEALVTMGRSGVNAYRNLADEAKQTAAMGFEPIADALNKILQFIADMLRQVRDLNPELIKVAGTLAGIIGLSQAGKAASLIPGVTVPGAGKIAKAGLIAATVYGGAQAGALATRGLAEAGAGGGFERFKGKSQGDVMSTLGTTLKQIGFLIFNVFIEIAKQLQIGVQYLKNGFEMIKAALALAAAAMGNAFAAVISVLTGTIGALLKGLGGMILQLDKIPGVNLGGMGQTFKEAGETAEHLEDGLRTSKETMNEYLDVLQRGIGLTDEQKASLDDQHESMNGLKLAFAEWLGLIEKAEPAIGALSSTMQAFVSGLGAAAAGKVAETSWSDEQLAAFDQFFTDVGKIESDRQKARTDQLAQFEQDKLDLETRYQDDVSRVKDDEATRHTRAEADLNDKIGQLETQAQKEETERLKAHQRDMAKLDRDHRDKLVDSAARLDARAVIAEMKTYDRKKSDAEEEFTLETQQRAEQLAARIAQEREGFTKEEAQRAEDIQRKLTQMANQHAQELARLAAQNTTKLNQINTAAQAEYNARQLAFMKELNQLGGHMGRMFQTSAIGQAQLEAQANAWWARMAGMFTMGTAGRSVGSAAVGAVNSVVGGLGALAQWRVGLTHQFGGDVLATGPANLEEGEHILRRDTARMLRRALGGEITQPALLSAVRGGGSSIQVQVDVGGVQITAPEGTSVREIGNEVQGRFEYIFDTLLVKRLQGFAAAKGVNP